MPPRIDLSDSIDEIITRYLSGESCDAIAADYSVCRLTISGRLRERDVKIRKGGNKKINMAPHKDKIISEYLEGRSITQVAQLFPFSADTVHKALRRWKINLRPGVGQYVYEPNHTRLDTLDEHAKYFCGMIAADGNLCSQTYGAYHVTLISKDTDILKKFYAFWGVPDKKISVNKRGISRATITSNIIADQLIEKGITPKKSSTICISDKKLIYSRHFWRGYFDGDGYIGIINNKSQSVRLSLVSNSFCIIDQFIAFLNQRNVGGLNKRRYFNHFIWEKQGPEAIKIIKLLYSNCDIYLDRKMDLAKEIMNREVVK